MSIRSVLILVAMTLFLAGPPRPPGCRRPPRPPRPPLPFHGVTAPPAVPIYAAVPAYPEMRVLRD